MMRACSKRFTQLVIRTLYIRIYEMYTDVRRRQCQPVSLAL